MIVVVGFEIVGYLIGKFATEGLERLQLATGEFVGFWEFGE
jgi:hypothetical protein